MKPSLILSLLCVPFLSAAQMQVTGKTTVEDGSPLPFASVLLLNSSDSTLVQGQVSGSDGLFTIEVKRPGTYLVSISAVSFDTEFSNVFEISRTNSPVMLGNIRVRENTEQLKEVVVAAVRPMFEQKIDRTIINVQSYISKAGGSALDVLQRSPGVVVDKLNSTVALAGKQGVRVMINGKISRLPMQAVVQMLDGMNAENIERIELITTPPAKYEAEGDAGMINIVTKKNEDLGTNGSLSLFTGYGRRGKYGGTLNLNNRTKHLNIFGDLTSRSDYSKQFFNTEWTTPINGETTQTNSNNDRTPYTIINSGSVGFDLSLGKKTTITGLVSLFDRRWDMDAWANISRTVDQDLSSTAQMNSVEENDWLQFLGSIGLRHSFNPDFSLSVDLDRIDYNSQNPTDYYQSFYDNQGNPTTTAQLSSRKDTGIKIWTTAVDFTGKLSKKIRFEIGGKGAFTTLDNDIVIANLEDGEWTHDEALTSYAEMYENILAGYVSTAIKASDKLDIQAGLRYEHTRTNIDTRAQANVVDRNFGNWFPSIFFNKKINDNNSWVVSYSRRISRPSFFQLAPFVIFNDPNNFWSGNISLLPSFTDAVKAEYRYKSTLLSLQYSHDKNAITLFQPRINDDNKQVSMAQNLDYMNNFSATLSFPIQLTKWWEMQLNVVGSLSAIRVIYFDEPLSLSIKNFSFNGFQRFKLSKTISAELSGFYQSRQLFGILEFGEFGGLDFGVEKKFTNSSLRLAYSDILGTNKWRFNADIAADNLNTRTFIDFETTIVMITYSLNFGNKKLKSNRPGKSGSREEQDRLRE